MRIRNNCCIVIQKTTELSSKNFKNFCLSFAISQYFSIFEQNPPPDRKVERLKNQRNRLILQNIKIRKEKINALTDFFYKFLRKVEF